MELLERHFEIALETPDGIKKLRELILSLAMQGKLIPQDPNDQPASELLKEIETEKKMMFQEGKIKKQDPLLLIKPEQIPYALPEGWEWCRLGDVITSIIGGGTPSKTNSTYWNGNIPWASVKDLNVNVFLEKTIDSISKLGLENSSTNIIPENNIIVCTRMGLGKIVINKIEVAINQDLKALILSKKIDQMFFFRNYQNYDIKGKGVTVKGIRQDELINFLVPLPPLAEQKRIVAKIDQLLALCDKLEIERNERNQKRLTIHTAAINRILSAPAPDKTKFYTSWEFISRNFEELYSIPQNVEELKKAILQLAVMGKLVPQDPNDQPASELLKEIEAEKKRLIKEGKLKRQQPLPPIKPAEIMYEVPKGWEWTQLNILGEINPRNNLDDEILAAFVPMPLILAEYGKTHSFEVRKWSEIKTGYTHFSENDVVLAKITPCFENGKSCVMKKLPNGVGAGTTELHVFRNSSSKMCPEYILAYLKSPQFILNGIPKMTGSAGQKRVSKEYFACSPFPLPPLAEQKRIVAKLDQLMELCNALEQQIKNSVNKQTALLNAVLAKI